MARLGLVNWSLIQPAPVIGVDEVGRGCLAGPVVAAAVVLSSYSRRRRFFDSKQLSAARREELLIAIQSTHQWCVGFASAEEIDRVNIYHASLLAMRRAIAGLCLSGGHVLVDGKARIPDLCDGHVQTTLIGGDGRCEPISAASIVAKVTRDRWMKDLALRYPGYGFEIHKGYATELHRTQLAKLGPCPEHRRSFSWSSERDASAAVSEELELE
jgi:ribonuclease HII